MGTACQVRRLTFQPFIAGSIAKTPCFTSKVGSHPRWGLGIDPCNLPLNTNKLLPDIPAIRVIQSINVCNNIHKIELSIYLNTI
jgi:hypothetical protein